MDVSSYHIHQVYLENEFNFVWWSSYNYQKSTNVLLEDFYCDRDSLFSDSLRRRVQMVYWLVKYLCEEKDWKTFTQMFFFSFWNFFVLLFSSTTFLLKTFCYSFCRKKINGTCKKLCLSFLILITSSKGLHSLNY